MSATIYELLRDSALRFPDRPALEFMERVLTYKEFLGRIDTAAQAYMKSGIGSGDRAAICMPNSPQMLVALYALNRIGAVAVLINPLTLPIEFTRYIEETGCKSILVLDIFMKKFYKSIKASNKLENIIFCSLSSEMPLGTALQFSFATFPRLVSSKIAKAGLKLSGIENKSVFTWKTFTKKNYNKEDLPDTVEVADNPEADAVILFSGGTSSKPKAVMHSSASINASVLQALLTEPPIEEGMSMLAVLPGFHAFGLSISIHTAFIAGGRCILVPRFDTEMVAGLIIKKKPTYIAGVPTIFAGILRSKILQKADQDGTLDMKGFRLAFCGGDKLPEELRLKFNNLVRSHGGSGMIAEGYGLTECCPVTVMPRTDRQEGSLGKPFPGIKLCIVKPGSIEELAIGEEGEICINALSVMSGYLNDPNETAKALKLHNDGNCWLHTGDIGKLDSDGFLYYSYRLNHMIKVSGYSVYPAHVESILETHHMVEKACLVGIPDSYSMCRLKAYIILKKGCSESKARHEILEFCKQRLMPWAIPHEIEFRSELPQTLLGKIAWGQLEEKNKQVSW